jgi:hypothetical protein
MPRIEGTTNAQTAFLRAFRSNPAGPPAELWPAPAILRRWMRRPAFLQALTSIRQVMRFGAHFNIAAAASQAALTLANPDCDPLTPQQSKQLLDLIRFDYQRQRFPVEEPDLSGAAKIESDPESPVNASA